MQIGTRFGTRDMSRAAAFYDAIAKLLGARRIIERDEMVAYQGASGSLFAIGIPLAGQATVGNGSQVGFGASSPEMVDAVYAKAIELGGKCEGPPGPRGPAEMGVYSAYFRDLDGNKLVVTHISGGLNL